MAENKLSWTELRRALADRAGVSEKDANTFLNAMNAQLIEALKQDKQLKINGLGMFKLQAVAPRKSVNVTTGEEIIIEGYNKIAFVPEAGVKELVESTNMKANNENVDPIQKLGEQAEEIKDILGNLGQDPANESVESAPVEAAPVVEPTYVPDPEPAYVPPTFSIPDPTPEPEAPKAEPKRKKKKESHFMRDTLICFVILLLLALVGYFFFRDQISGWVDELMSRIHPVEQVEVVEAEPVVEEVASPKAAMYGKAVDDIRLAISLGDRFLYQRELFGQNAELMQRTLTELNELGSFDEAMSYISRFNWDTESNTYQQFLVTLHRRFG